MQSILPGWELEFLPPQFLSSNNMDVDGGVAHKQLTPLSEALYYIWAPRAFTFVHQPLSKLKAPEKEYEILRESILVQIVIKAEEADTHGTRKAGLIKKKIITDVQEVVGGATRSCKNRHQNPEVPPDVVKLMNNGRELTPQFAPFSTGKRVEIVGDLRRRAGKWLNIEPSQIRLRNEQLPLEHNRELVKAYGVRHNSTVYCIVEDARSNAIHSPNAENETDDSEDADRAQEIQDTTATQHALFQNLDQGELDLLTDADIPPADIDKGQTTLVDTISNNQA